MEVKHMVHLAITGFGTAGGALAVLALSLIVTSSAGMSISWVFGLALLVFVVAGAVALVGRSFR